MLGLDDRLPGDQEVVYLSRVGQVRKSGTIVKATKSKRNERKRGKARLETKKKF